jgi:serine protease Do
VLRDGEEKQLSVKISDLARARETAQAQGGDGQLGMRVQKVTPQIARELGMDEPEGVVITGLAPGSPAAEAGLGRGDVVLRVNNERVNDSGEFEQQVARSAGRGSVLLLVRDAASGSTGYLTVPLDGR